MSKFVHIVDVELAAGFYLHRAQMTGVELGLPRFSFTGHEDDDELHAIADSAFETYSRGPLTEQLAADLFAYRLIRDTTDLQCAHTAEHRIRLIVESFEQAGIDMLEPGQ